MLSVNFAQIAKIKIQTQATRVQGVFHSTIDKYANSKSADNLQPSKKCRQSPEWLILDSPATNALQSAKCRVQSALFSAQSTKCKVQGASPKVPHFASAPAVFQ